MLDAVGVALSGLQSQERQSLPSDANYHNVQERLNNPLSSQSPQRKLCRSQHPTVQTLRGEDVQETFAEHSDNIKGQPTPSDSWHVQQAAHKHYWTN